MKIEALGHVVIKVSDMAKANEFYEGLLGLPVCAKAEGMTFYSLGNHHDFAVAEVGQDAQPADQQSVGLAHVAFKIGDDLDKLREAKARLDDAEVETMAINHNVTQSLYFSDPDGNGVELYIDASDVWKEDSTRVAHIEPLEL
ncbi:MAG TPA: glyoxalase [Gammaproteobacteria bacterium]|nr:glyoxalase [Gammaproteobacteria bacterium]|tara:strand:- start:1318 stop:1746 length:429 start_codon:yes stop_codon:yes gene_type:complete